MARLSIALMSDWFAPRIGGIELHLQELALQLRARGHHVQISTTTPGPSTFCGIPVHRIHLPMISGWDVAVPNLLRIPVFVRVVRTMAPDVLHAHGALSVAAIGGLVACRHLGIPSIMTHHSLLPGGQLWGARALYAVFSHRADLVSAVSRAAAADARAASGRRTIAVLPNGISPSDWRLAGRTSADVHIVSVMRLTRTKSPDVLVRAFARLVARQRSGDAVRLTIAGDGPERAGLEEMTRALSIADRVTFAGALPREGVRALLADASIFALPCEMEAFGIAALEARCAGVPVVAMNRGGIPEVITHDVHGLLADSGDAFVDHLVRLVEDAGLRRRLATRGPNDLAAFAWDRVVDRHLRVYRATIANHRRPRRL